jgi:hypothetical protein
VYCKWKRDIRDPLLVRLVADYAPSRIYRMCYPCKNLTIEIGSGERKIFLSKLACLHYPNLVIKWE